MHNSCLPRRRGNHMCNSAGLEMQQHYRWNSVRQLRERLVSWDWRYTNQGRRLRRKRSQRGGAASERKALMRKEAESPSCIFFFHLVRLVEQHGKHPCSRLCSDCNTGGINSNDLQKKDEAFWKSLVFLASILFLKQKQVDISSKGLRELPALPATTTQLLVYENFLSSIEALSSLQNLQYLDAGQNALYHLSGQLINQLRNLQVGVFLFNWFRLRNWSCCISLLFFFLNRLATKYFPIIAVPNLFLILFSF